MAIANGGVSGAPDDNFDSDLPDAEPYGTADHDAPGDDFGAFRPYSEDRGYDAYEDEDAGASNEQEPLRRQLAQFAFVREEDDREVRLFFRDVPAHEIARAFRGSGALLISIAGERALSPTAVAASAQAGWVSTEVAPDTAPAQATTSKARRKRNRKAQAAAENPGAGSQTTATSRPNRQSGELTMRYFFSLGELVYTVNISTPTGLVESVASIFPSAALSERELHTRLAVVFREVSG